MNLSESAQRVQKELAARGIDAQIVETAESTRTAAEAAQAIGCTVAQIVKSLVFQGTVTGQAILIEASGVNRVNERAVAELIGEPIHTADAEFVREKTGYAIGGVPPVGHATEISTVLIDEDLLQYEKLWAAAGTPHAVFSLTPQQLIEISHGKVAAIK